MSRLFEQFGLGGFEAQPESSEGVLVDATALDCDHRTRGIGRYVAGLLYGMEQVAGESPFARESLRYLRLGGPLHSIGRTKSGGHDETGRYEPPEERVARLNRPPGPHLTRWMLNELSLSEELSGACALFHSTEPASIAVGSDFKTVVTVHDVIPLMFPDIYMQFPYLFWPLYYPRLERTGRWGEVDRIIAISEATKRELNRHLGIPSEQVSVVHNGIDHRQFRPVDDPETIRTFRRRHSLGDRFVLYLGGDDFRKNVGVLVRALPYLPDDVELCLAGGIGESKKDELVTTAEELRVADRLVFPGYVDDEELTTLYAAAEVFAYPSLAEGFGLQILEAMAVGSPVVVSDRSSLPEVAGDAGLTADPTDAEAFGETLRRCLEDDNLRAELEEKGLSRASEFSWERTAEETLEVYRSVLS